jgi:hypothetical protein
MLMNSSHSGVPEDVSPKTRISSFDFRVVGKNEVIREPSAPLLRASYGVRGDENASDLGRDLTSYIGTYMALDMLVW